MASHRLKSLYAIKECSTCGRLYTRECCSIGNLEDKILVPVPDSSPRCARCGTPVDGPSCRGCAFLRKKFDEDLLTYCVENGIFKDFQDTSESFDDNTKVVNALREPSVVNQDLGIKSSQEPPQIDHNCCYECGDSLDGIFCQQCICKFYGKGAHYGYNCPPKVLIISNPEKCNQTINELPQILPNENSFNYDSKPHSFNVSPSVLTYPPQLQFETYLCELCGNNAHYGYDCSPQFLSPHETFQCQPMNEDYFLNKMEEKLEEIIRDRRKKIEDMSIEEMMHEQQLVDREIKEIINDLGYQKFQGEEIDEEYERDCEIRIRNLKQILYLGMRRSSKKRSKLTKKKSILLPVVTCFLLLEVIQKGNGPVSVTTDTDEVIRVLPPRTAKETLAREKRTKRHGPILLMALPEDHLAKFHKMTDAKDMWDAIKSRFGGNDEYKKMQEEPKALVTVDGEGVDWTNHSEEDEDYALMACNGSDSDTEVTSCSTKCKESYANLKKLYDAQREQLSDASIEIKAYSQGLKKVEAQLVAHQQGQLWYEQKIKFMKIDLDDKIDVLTYHKKLLAEAQKEKDDLKAKVEKWHHSSKNLGKLLNSQMSAYDKFRLGYGDHRYNGILSYENEDLQSVFKGKESDFNNPPLNDKSVKTGEMHVVALPMIGNYMPSGPDIEIDYSQFTYEPSELVSEPVVNESNVECQPKVWSDAPIIEEYESDSEDEDYDFHEKRMAKKPDLNNGLNNVQRVNKQNQFVPSAVLTRTGKIPVNTAKASSTKNFSTARQSFNRQTVLTSTAIKVNTFKPIVNRVRPEKFVLLRQKGKLLLSPQQVVIGDNKDTTGTISPNTMVDLVLEIDYPHRALKNKGVVDSGCSRHMTVNIVEESSLIEFRESLKRVTDGTEALLILTLFILWLDKGNSAKGSWPRSVSISEASINKQLANVFVPLDHFAVNTLTSKVFSFMVKKGKHFSGKVTPLFATMLVHPTPDEGAHSERPSDAQSTPSPASTKTSGGNLGDQAKEIQHLKAQIIKLKKQAKPVIQNHRAWLKSVTLKQRLTRKRFSKKQRVHKDSVSKQGKMFAKGESSVQRDPLFDEIPEDTVDHMETENAQDVGRTRDRVDEDKEIEENKLSTEDVLSTDKEVVSTDKERSNLNQSTDEQIESTDEQRKGTEDHTEEGSTTQATQTPTSTIFRDDETIAKVLLNMSQAKAVSREKEKGVELKDIEETDRPRPTSTRSLLTLKPLPKIDPKDKGKKKIEEEDESESESDGIPEAEKKFKQLESDEEMARKIQEEWEGEEERNRIAEEKATNEALIRNYDDIKARIEADRLLAKKLQEEERE
ncbi:hypothetical protein Tco_1523664 [Tanacetum coccineum]